MDKSTKRNELVLQRMTDGDLQLGVCGWCLDRHSIERSLEIAGHVLNVDVVQIGFFTEESVRSFSVDSIRALVDKLGITVCGSFLAFEGEDYSTIGSISRTGGFMDDATFAKRLRVLQRATSLTASIGATSMAIHAGTVPKDSSSRAYAKLLERVRESADIAGELDVRLLLETGREPIDALTGFLVAVDRDNVGISFDPGNLVIYGTDDPVAAVSKLGNRIEIVHLKDAWRSARPGIDYGSPAELGLGHVQIPRVISKLRTIQYEGPLLLEVRDDTGGDTLGRGLDYVRSLL